VCRWCCVKMGEVGRASAWTLQVASLPEPREREEVGGVGKPTPLPGEGRAAERAGRLVDASETAGHSHRRCERSRHACLDSLVLVTSSRDRGDADRVVAHGVGIDGCVNAFVSNDVDRRCVLAASGFARAGYALAQHRCWRRRSLGCTSVRQREREGEGESKRNGMRQQGTRVRVCEGEDKGDGSGGLHRAMARGNVGDAAAVGAVEGWKLAGSTGGDLCCAAAEVDVADAAAVGSRGLGARWERWR
jgi:hypothetical protein